MVLLDEQDRALATGEAVTVDSTTVCAAVDPMAAGVHAVEYSLTADDGHVVLGRYPFEVLPDAADATVAIVRSRRAGAEASPRAST